MKLLKLLIGLVVLLVVAVVVVGLFADSLAKKAIEAGGTYALGTDTKVDSVSIGFLSSTFAMEGLSVANPKGFGDGNFLDLGKGSIAVSGASLLSDTIEVPEMGFSKIRVRLVQGPQGSNYGTILSNLERIQGEEEAAASSSDGGDAEAGKHFQIKRLVLTDIVVEAVPVPALNVAAVQIPIDRIQLDNVGTNSDQGVLLSDLAGILVEAILKQATATGQLPGMIQGALSGQLGGLQGLADAGIQALDGILPGGTSNPASDAVKNALNEGLKGLPIGVGR